MTYSAISMWSEVELALNVVQTVAFLEIVHSFLGWVKSPWQTTFIQVSSRLWILWAVLHISPAAQESMFMKLTVVSWSLVEVPRYLFYALNLLQRVPYPLFWLRYSLFAALYPSGISGEVGCLFVAGMSLLGNEKVLSELPVSHNLLLATYVLSGMAYIPGAPLMYGHMLKTRRKQFEMYKKDQMERK